MWTFPYFNPTDILSFGVMMGSRVHALVVATCELFTYKTWALDGSVRGALFADSATGLTGTSCKWSPLAAAAVVYSPSDQRRRVL
jgi:hypothetical protein